MTAGGANANAIASRNCENAPIAVQGVKAVANFWRNLFIDEHYQFSGWVNKHVGASEDSKEGPKAFAERRQPQWQNR